MNQIIFLLKVCQVLANIVIIVIAAGTIWKVSSMPITILSSDQMHLWISQDSKAEFERLFIECQEALAGMENALTLLAKWVLQISALNLGFLILECLIRAKAKTGPRTISDSK
jgi:hypothetical protein